MVAKKSKKIAVVTGTRAEYGLLYWIMREIRDDADLQLQLVVTGMHLSPEFGSTYKFIEADGFDIDAKVEMLLSSDTASGTAKSIALGIIGLTEIFDKLSPDLILILGDRFEMLAVAQVALVHRIPVAHIHGGELSEGAIDDAIRHSITKMSHLHFVAAEPYRKRVIQLGESHERVFNVGAPGLERIKKTKLLTLPELKKKINIQLGKLNFLVTYHPETISISENSKAIKNLLDALDCFPTANIIFTEANADENGRFINDKISQYVLKNKNRAISYTSLGDLNYLSLLQFIDVVIGNSSSGIIEAPCFKKPTVNIGNRQKSRLRAASIVDSSSSKNEIIAAINKALSCEFKKVFKGVKLPYTISNTAKKIKYIIKKVDLKAIIVKKFNDFSERSHSL